MDYLDTRPWKTEPTSYPKDFVRWVYGMMSLLQPPANQSCNPIMVDWGCGTGDFTREFEAIGIEVAAFDKLFHHEGVHKVDFDRMFRQTVVASDTAHFAFCRNVLEHLREPEHLLKEMRRTLRPQGVAVITVPDWRTYHEIFYSDHTHVQPYDKTSIADLLRTNGFHILSLQEIVQYAPCWSSPRLRLAANLCRNFVPLRWAQALADRTGWEFWRWACLRTIVVFCVKGEERT